MKMFNGLPLYEDKILDDACGMLRISLVDLPAVESDFQKFGKPVLVKMADESKRLIMGCVCRAGFPVYRRDARGEYYVQFTADTIRVMAEKYLEENRQNRVNLMHAGEEVRGVQMVELFIKDSGKGISPKGFEDIEEGSLFATFHINDENIWSWVREGVLRGFSLEGLFVMEESEITEDMKINFTKMKTMLAKIVSKFTQVATDKGVLTFEGEPEVGKDVYFLEESGEVTDANDGEYTLEDGTVLVIEGSKIAEIRKPEEPKRDTSEVSDEPAEDNGDDEDFIGEEEPAAEVADDVDIHNLAAEVDRLKEENEKKKAELADLIKRVEALEGKSDTTEEALRKMSVAKPAHEEIKGSAVTDTMESYLTKHQKFLAGIAASVKK